MTDYTVVEADSGIRLDRWFKRHLPGVTHGLLEKSLRKGDIRVGGKKAKSSDRVETGHVIECRKEFEGQKEAPVPLKNTITVMSEADRVMMQQAVLYKDDDVIVINKPPGLAVQGGSGINKSVDNLLDALRYDSKERPKLVHRLDRDTSGALVLARSAKVAAKLMKEFSGKTAQKTYWALIKGVPDLLQGKIDLPLAKQEVGDHEKVAIDEDDGKRAVTLYEVVERLSKTLAWVELTPITGRTHQLRVHMAAIGHPIIGDGKYGGADAFIEGMDISNKLHLHAHRIVIPGMLDVTAPLPKHMQDSWKKLGLD
jgi:23S rRNA pseudouridine955/2504/2580 synthase